MTPTEITTHALALGITPELYPEFWRCTHCQRSCARCICGGTSGHVCTLPDPLSDSPRCAIWRGFLMEALGWDKVICWNSRPTTAALHAAWLAEHKPELLRGAIARVEGAANG